MSFNRRLKEVMAMRGVSATMLAKDLNITRGRVSSMTTGRVETPRKDVDAIARYLDVSELWLMHGSGRPEGDVTSVYQLEDAKIVKTGTNIRLRDVHVNSGSFFIDVTSVKGFANSQYFILTPEQKGDGLYLLYKNNGYFLAHRIDNILNSEWIVLSKETLQDAEVIGYIDAFFRNGYLNEVKHQ